MLDKMRKQSQSTLIVVLFGFIIFVFVFSFGAGSVGFRRGGCGRLPVVAVVNGEEVGELEFHYQYEQAARNLASRGREMTSREARLELRRQVLEEIVNRKLLVQAARRLGLHVSDQERNDSIREAFRDKDGHFDPQRYKMYLTRYLNTTPAIFEENWRERMLAERMADFVQAAARVTEEELREAFRLQETKIRLRFVHLPLSLFKAKDAVGADLVEKFLAENKERVEKYYRDHFDEYNKPKKVELAHIFFELRQEFDKEQIKEKQEQAELTLANLKKGTSFEQEAKDYSDDQTTREEGGRLGVFSRQELAARWGDKLADAALALGEGETSAVVQSEKGLHILKALKVIPAEEKPLSAVEKEIAARLLEEDRASQEARKYAENLLAELRAGKPFEKLVPLATENKKEGEQIILEDTDFFPWMGGFIPKLGLDENLARAAFSLDKNHPLPEKVFEMTTSLGERALVVFELVDRQEPDWDKFAQARSQLEEKLLAGRRMARLADWLKKTRATAEIEYNKNLLTQIGPTTGAPVEDDF